MVSPGEGGATDPVHKGPASSDQVIGDWHKSVDRPDDVDVVVDVRLTGRQLDWKPEDAAQGVLMPQYQHGVCPEPGAAKPIRPRSARRCSGHHSGAGTPRKTLLQTG